ncbi:radical SAM protein [Thermoproteota archaeon]
MKAILDTQYKEIPCKTVLGNFGILGTRFWTSYSFDPYTNCGVNCVYCNSCAINYDGSRHSPVYIKTNAPQILAKELTWFKRKGVLRMGIWADPYQPAEKKYRITEQILRVLEDHKFPFAIGTKSDLILRDLDLISEASKKTHCCAALSLSTLDEKMAKLLEPNAPSPKRRLEVVKKLSESGVTTGVWLAPIFPHWTDTTEDIGRVVEAAVENGAKFVAGAVFDMRNPAQSKLFLKDHFVELVPKYERMYAIDRPCHYPDDDFYLHGLAKKFISECQTHKIEMFLPHFSTRRQAWSFYLQNLFKLDESPFVWLTQLLSYLYPYQEMLQTVQIKFGKSSASKSFLKVFRYFPH